MSTFFDTEAMSFVKAYRDGVLIKESLSIVESTGLKVSEALRLSLLSHPQVEFLRVLRLGTS